MNQHPGRPGQTGLVTTLRCRGSSGHFGICSPCKAAPPRARGPEQSGFIMGVVTKPRYRFRRSAEATEYTHVSARGANAEIRPVCDRTTPTAQIKLLRSCQRVWFCRAGGWIGGSYQYRAAVPRYRRHLAYELQGTKVVAFMRKRIK